MAVRPLRLLYIQEKPIQNDLPFEYMQENSDVHMKVIFINDGVEHASVENLNASVFKFDHPKSYPHIFLNTVLNKLFFLIKEIQQADTVVVFGYYHIFQKLSIVFSKLLKKKIIITTDSTSDAGTAYSSKWKQILKPLWIKFIYNSIANGVWVPSSAAEQFLISRGVQPGKIALTPYVVDEKMIIKKSLETNIVLFRECLQLPQDIFVFVYCAKFIDRKRPLDVLQAAQILIQNNVTNFHICLVGDGPLMPQITQFIRDHHLENHITTPGFVQYEDLPSWYTASNALLFTSSHEPYGLPVNEAMLCGLPVVVSDQIGAAKDLVNSDTGFVYPVGDIHALANYMELLINDSKKAQLMGDIAKKQMMNWGSKRNYEEQIKYFSRTGLLN